MKKILLTLSLILFVASCAKIDSIDPSSFVDESFKAWVAKNDPKAVALEGNPNVYITFYQRGPVPADTTKILEFAWMYMDMNAYTLNGDVIYSRDSTMGRITGNWKNTTHWTPNYVQQYSNSNTLCKGLYNALFTMRPGDNARVYISSNEAFPSYKMVMNSGYQGNAENYQGFPVYFDVKIHSVTHKALRSEMDSVQKIAASWGLLPSDSIIKGMYKRTLIPNPKGDSIKLDSIVLINRSEYFPDGFLISTNIDSVARKANRYEEKESDIDTEDYYSPTEVEVANNSVISKALQKALLNMKKGETAEFITISDNTTIGNIGDFTATPQILPFQPIRMVVSVIDTVLIR